MRGAPREIRRSNLSRKLRSRATTRAGLYRKKLGLSLVVQRQRQFWLVAIEFEEAQSLAASNCKPAPDLWRHQHDPSVKRFTVVRHAPATSGLSRRLRR